VAAWFGVAAGLTVLVAGLLAVALLVWRDRSGPGADGAVRVATSTVAEASERSGETSTGSSVPPGEQAVPVVGRGADLHAAACGGTLVLASVSAPVTDPGLVEVSGVAVSADGVAWVVNDSGDSARVFGLRPAEGGTLAVQTVTVTGAENVDWEDVAIGPGSAEPVLWLADTGDNLGVRPTVTLYRVPVPAPEATAVAAEAVTVTYPDGPHDVEAVVAEPDGAVVLLTKEPGRSRAYRVAPRGRLVHPPARAHRVLDARRCGACRRGGGCKARAGRPAGLGITDHGNMYGSSTSTRSARKPGCQADHRHRGVHGVRLPPRAAQRAAARSTTRVATPRAARSSTTT
jgi:hypothetical protein